MSDSGKLSVAWLYDDSLDRDDGVAQYVKTLGAWMSDQGHSVSYLVGDSKLKSWHGGPVYSLSKNLNVRWGGNRLSVPIKPRLNDIKALVSERKFDVVHVTAPYSPLMAKEVINRLPDRTVLIGTWHIYPASRVTIAGSKLLKPTYGRSLKRFDGFVSVSSAAQEYAKKAFRCDSHIIPNVIDLASFAAPKQNRGQKPRIVFLGRLVKRKGVMEFIKAIASLRHDLNFTDFETVIAGDGPQRLALEKLTRHLGVAEQVKFIGYIDESEKPSLLASADIACFPSLFGESFGLVLIEAMAAGAGVVIGGDNPGYRTVLAGRPKLLVDVGQNIVPDLAGCLFYFLTHPQDAAEIHEWQATEIQKYDVKTVGPQIIKLYEQAIAKRLTSGHN